VTQHPSSARTPVPWVAAPEPDAKLDSASIGKIGKPCPVFA
jgi:hypothetical protein